MAVSCKLGDRASDGGDVWVGPVTGGLGQVATQFRQCSKAFLDYDKVREGSAMTGMWSHQGLCCVMMCHDMS